MSHGSLWFGLSFALMASLFFSPQSWGYKSLITSKSIVAQKTRHQQQQKTKKTKKCCSYKFLKVKRLINLYTIMCQTVSDGFRLRFCFFASWFTQNEASCRHLMQGGWGWGWGWGQCTYCDSGLMPDACYNMHPWCCRHVCFRFFLGRNVNTCAPSKWATFFYKYEKLVELFLSDFWEWQTFHSGVSNNLPSLKCRSSAELAWHIFLT